VLLKHEINSKKCILALKKNLLILLYNVITHIANFGLKLVTLFNSKIKLGVVGRKQTFRILRESINEHDKTIWFHCASLGEYEQGLPVFEEIKKLYQTHKIILSFFSPSGYENKNESSIADVVVYLPLDTKSNAKKFLNIVNPELGVSYTPYLSKLVNDIFLGNITYYNRINERSAFAGSFKYFSLGEIEITDLTGTVLENVKPNEFALDATYSLRLSDQFAMAVTGRYLNSDLKISYADPDAGSASSFAVDVTGYYQSEENAYNDFNGRWRGGFALQNIGPKIKYTEGGTDNFLPATLRLGGGFDFIFDDFNKLAVTAEFTKLMVPTPPITGKEYEYTDNNSNGVYDDGDDRGVLTNDRVIIEGKEK